MKTLYTENLATWHSWLVENSLKEPEIWLVFYKKESGKPCITYEESIEEALCFGWVDSLIKARDEESHLRKFTPRKPGSKWSDLNVSRAQKMIAAGRMTEAGLALFSRFADNRAPSGEARKTIAEGFRRDLHALLDADVLECYNRLPPSLQRQYAGWVMSARKEDTRKRRIEELSSVLLKGERLGLK